MITRNYLHIISLTQMSDKQKMALFAFSLMHHAVRLVSQQPTPSSAISSTQPHCLFCLLQLSARQGNRPHSNTEPSSKSFWAANAQLDQPLAGLPGGCAARWVGFLRRQHAEATTASWVCLSVLGSPLQVPGLLLTSLGDRGRCLARSYICKAILVQL